MPAPACTKKFGWLKRLNTCAWIWIECRSVMCNVRASPRSIASIHGPENVLYPMPGTDPAPEIPAAVLPVDSLMALSFSVLFAPLQFAKLAPVQELASRPVYGRPELNCIKVLMVQSERRRRAP